MWLILFYALFKQFYIVPNGVLLLYKLKYMIGNINGKLNALGILEDGGKWGTKHAFIFISIWRTVSQDYLDSNIQKHSFRH